MTFSIVILTDVVRAYKGILKEKEALEASLKALGQVKEEEGEGEGGGGGGTSDAEKTSEVEEREGDGEGEGGEGGGRQSESEEGEHNTSAVTPEKKVIAFAHVATQKFDGQLLFQPPSDAAVVASLRQQLSTLTSSLQTLTVERAKMESGFQKDKKNLLVRERGRVDWSEKEKGRERGRG